MAVLKPDYEFLVSDMFDFITNFILEDKDDVLMEMYNKFLEKVSRKVTLDDLDLDEDERECEEEARQLWFSEYFKHKNTDAYSKKALVELLKCLPKPYSSTVVEDDFDGLFTILIFKKK